MTEERVMLAELLEKAGDGDFLRAVAEAVLQLLMESDVEGLIGAGRYERSGERITWRNGYRERTLDTRLKPFSAGCRPARRHHLVSSDDIIGIRTRRAILDGRQPPDLSADKLLKHSRLPLAWNEQRTMLGFP